MLHESLPEYAHQGSTRDWLQERDHGLVVAVVEGDRDAGPPRSLACSAAPGSCERSRPARAVGDVSIHVIVIDELEDAPRLPAEEAIRRARVRSLPRSAGD